MQLAEVQAKVQAEVILVRVQTEDARVGMVTQAGGAQLYQHATESEREQLNCTR